MIRLLLLPSVHRITFQRKCVRTSIPSYQNFILTKGRSLGFGSAICYQFAQLVLAFALATPIMGLTCNKQQLAGSLCKRHAVTHIKRTNCSINIVLLPLVSIWFQVLFHSPKRGSFHLSLTLLVHYRIPKVFSLRRWASLIHAGFHVTSITWEITEKPLLFSSTGLSPFIVRLSCLFV